MSDPSHDVDELGDDPPRAARRAAMGRLAESLRRITDVAVCTNLPPDEVDDVARRIDALTEELAREQHDGPYSGLLPRERDHRFPHRTMPLSPIAGDLSPIRPDIALRVREDQRVEGTAVLSKKFVGPANFAHGGVTAMICDQLVALATRMAGVRRGLTAELTVRYRRPTPLYEPLELAAWCEVVDAKEGRAFAEIRAGEKPCVVAEARIRHAGWMEGQDRQSAPPASIDGPQRRA